MLKTCLSDGRYLDFVQLICEVACRAIRNPSKIKWARDWAELLTCSERFKKCLSSSAVPFSYVRGAVAEATEHGDWLLVDEINLASSECLDALMNLLEDSYHKHPKFRLFACMNPVTDIGKKNLPLSVRSRFTEIFIRETRDAEQLGVIVRTYLPSIQPTRLCSVLNLYEALCHKYPGKYSLRSLCRALSFASDNFFGSDLRSLQEAIEMSFLTDLNLESRTTVLELIHKYLGKKTDSAIPPPDYVAGKYINVENYYIRRGTNEPQDDPLYVRTPSVRKNLAQLSRVVCSGRYPVLLEGETSTGKTAMVIHLAKISGNTVIRINNHEHTDLQEYIGSYAPDRNGKLIFMEGALLKAMKAGYWVILDELNLAASDVIEALNRLLDDNRELYVSELNTTVRAHQSFRLFATQNPAGSYAGRKRLSRALLNRFVILRFDHLPFSELSQMVVAS
ncbi:hypothetical protein AB6A40_008208 [Gnathostoma spinigerum]|uniref:Midasin n=1 Tax=Gnathostoma spinigerum TaxID=75299 RepID=A0ABD6EW66_9BILA